MDMKQALYDLGVRDNTLTSQEKICLDNQGYLPLRGILTAEQVIGMRDRIEELIALDERPQHDEGVDGIDYLVNRDPIFEVCFTHPRVIAAISHVLSGEFKLLSLNARVPSPGFGQQRLHNDWNADTEPGTYYICNSIWPLVDFTEQTGATRAVPGTHRNGNLPNKDCPVQHKHSWSCNPMESNVDEVKLMAQSGTVIVCNGHIWHSGTLNTSSVDRPAMTCAFVRRDQLPDSDEAKQIGSETYSRLDKASRYILNL